MVLLLELETRSHFSDALTEDKGEAGIRRTGCELQPQTQEGSVGKALGGEVHLC